MHYATVTYLYRESGVVDEVESSPQVNTEDLTDITMHVVQITDDGTVTAHVEYTLDGTVWVQVGADVAHTDFPAGANTAVARTLSDGNGMSLAVQGVRLRASVHTGTGTYKLLVAGHQKPGYR